MRIDDEIIARSYVGYVQAGINNALGSTKGQALVIEGGEWETTVLLANVVPSVMLSHWGEIPMSEVFYELCEDVIPAALVNTYANEGVLYIPPDVEALKSVLTPVVNEWTGFKQLAWS